LDLVTPERREAEHLSRQIQGDDIMKRLLQVSGGVTGPGADLYAPSARERPAPGERIHQRVVTLWHVSVAPARSKRIEQCGDLCPSFPRPCAIAHRNRPRQLSHRTRCISPLRPPRLVRYDPGQLDHAHRTQPTDDAHRPRVSRLQPELLAKVSTHTEWPVGSVNGSRGRHTATGAPTRSEQGDARARSDRRDLTALT
jgi:hypothetical protein